MSATREGRSAALATAGILASRLVGFVRQRFLAHYLGTSGAADAVTAAFRIGNLTQNLLGEGTLSASLVPVYVRLRLQGADVASRFARAALGVVIAAALLLSLAGVLFAPSLAALLAPGLAGDRLALTVELVRIVFPMTGLLVLGAWALGILTSHGRFLLPYAAPVVWSAAQIAALAYAGSVLGQDEGGIARSVAWGALGGAALQAVVLFVPVRRLLGRAWPSLDRGADGLSEAVRRVPGALLGRGVMQLSGLVDTLLASLLGPGAIATLAYAQTIYLLPMAVLGTGEAAAALPKMAEQAADRDRDRAALRASLSRSLTRVSTLAVPAAAVFGALAPEVTDLLFRGGSFGAGSAADVAEVLALYAAGLPANAAGRVLGATAFALGDTARPARYAAVRVVVSTGIAIATMGTLGVGGVVVGAAVAAWVEAALLVKLVGGTLGGAGLAEAPLVRVGVCGIATAGAGLGARVACASYDLHAVLVAGIVLATALVGFLASSRVLGLGSLGSLMRSLRR